MAVRKILHAADIHLDSPLLRLEHYPGAPVDEIRSATRKALTRMVDLAIVERVDLVVIAGDLYDGDWNEISTGLFFVNEASRLVRSGIPLVVIRGNHDAANLMTQSLPLPKNPDGNAIMLDHNVVDRRLFDQLGIVVTGRSFPTRAVTDDLSLGYPAPIQGMFNLGLLHTSLTGAEGHDTYSPCTPKQLQDKGYDYWALGHIHDRRECHTVNETPIIFSGNIQGRNIREVGAKGCVIVSIADNNTPTMSFHSLDVVRWQIFEHDISQDMHRNDLFDAFSIWIPEQLELAEGRPLAVRVNVKGTSKLSEDYQRHVDAIANDLRSIATQHGEKIWFENLKVRCTVPRKVRTLDSDQMISDDPLGSIREVIESIRIDDAAQAAMIETVQSLWRKLPQELIGNNDANKIDPFKFDSPEQIMAWLDAAEPILLDEIQSVEGAV